MMAAKSMITSMGKRHHVLECTARTAIRRLVNRSNVPDTVVLDEAHFTSKEYMALFDILRNIRQDHTWPRFRLVLLSATMDEDSVRQDFPDISYHVLEGARTPFHVDIKFRDNCPAPYGMNQRWLVQETLKVIKEVLKENPSVDHKMVIFMASHEQCEVVRNTILTAKKSSDCAPEEIATLQTYEIITLHGGKTDEEFEESRKILLQGKRTICVCTNIAETAVTLPGTNVIIDSGFRCIVLGNTVIQDRCDKVCMIQRAGRTGRTCPGVVYRLMKQEQFDSLEFRMIPEFSYDSVVLQLFLENVDPVCFLNEKAEESIEKFVQIGLMPDHNTTPARDVVNFLDRCGLETRNGLVLLNFIRVYGEQIKAGIDGSRMLILLAIVIINMFDTKPVNVIYVPHGSNKDEVITIRAKIAREFGYDNDLLLSLIRIFLHVFLAKNPKEAANLYSFNFKVLREIRKDLVRISRFVDGDKVQVMDVLSTVDLEDGVTDGIRYFFACHAGGHFRVEPSNKRMRALYDVLWVDERSATTLQNSMYRITPASKIDPHRVRKQTFVPLSGGQNGMNIRLWVASPRDYRDRPGFLYRYMAKKRSEMDERIANRETFRECVAEIDNDVAYRPGMWKMENAQDHFLSLVHVLH